MSISNLPVSTTMTVEQALASVQKQTKDLKKVIVVGQYEDGDLFIHSSRMTCAEALWLIKRAEFYTLNPD